ncbi:hypothetical protein H310_11563 [Aphanomyces invadans]|uniref:Uncharacterized protein n=1 Tax=Aphanomyces invadans TaxID=157072 RepID=A0A024TNN3_9STRA|nr:hypothetical protein H310_11563 [Aphanomyces invadans]ETV94917.1 hypothetical protein H310_11563 [Aphanomyces invadans]|eukprot:XP_008876508.1 hypothetical protein H310_11563 [Aphanomyces invadans]
MMLKRDIKWNVFAMFDVHSSTGWRVWKLGNDSKSKEAATNVSTHKHRSGRKQRYTMDDIEQRIKGTPLYRRQSQRSLAKVTGLSQWSIWDFIRKKWITRVLVLPAIKRQCVCANDDTDGTIYVQHDNARLHISVDDAGFAAAAASGGWKIKLTCQPPQSPDLNILDLGFFNSVQSLQQQMECRSMAELIHAVDDSFK